MNHLCSTTAPKSTQPAQSFTSYLLVEAMQDSETGEHILCTSTDETNSDFQQVNSARALAQINETHKKLDQAAAFVHQWDAQQRSAQTIVGPDGKLTETGQKVCAELAESLAAEVAKAEDPRAFIAQWLQMIRAGAADLGSHFPWCQPGSCFTSTPDEHGEYTDHQGAEVVVRAPAHMPTEDGTLLRARLCSDASDGQGASVSISGANGNGTLLVGDELDPVIDDLAAFLDQLRTMRLHTKAAAA